jgi:hypothetical protein
VVPEPSTGEGNTAVEEVAEALAISPDTVKVIMTEFC